MKPRIIPISKRMIAAALVFLVLTFTGLYRLTVRYNTRQWKQQIFSPGLAGKKVIIDPGHGGADPGAMVGKVKESDINMSLARALQKQLEQDDVAVKMTRDGNTGLVPNALMTYSERWWILRQRKQLAMDELGHMLISVHVNSNKDTRVSGGMVFYSDDYSKQLAEKIQGRLNDIGRKKWPVQKRNFTVINDNVMPSVLIEAGFITNKHDRELLTTKPQVLAQAICRGIEDYLRGLKIRPMTNSTEASK